MWSLKRWLPDRRAGRSVAVHEAPLQVMRWWPTTVLVVLVVVSGGIAAMWLLGVWSVPKAPTDADTLRLDRIKTALTVAAGLAAAVTLLLTLRRQVLSERAQRFAESDALEQRTTALYVAAADQLGSDKAAVRLAGLYALERLGQDDPKLRQTVVDVWCSYLRMPYIPPIDLRKRTSQPSLDRWSDDPVASDPGLEGERRQELQVRLAAQRLLTAHMNADPEEAEEDTYWLDHRDKRMAVDLVGAVLVNFALESCALGGCDLSGAQFYGNAYMFGAQFHDNANLAGAEFHGKVILSESQFHGHANLDWVVFHRDAHLDGAVFHRDASLFAAEFHGEASLVGGQFHGDVYMSVAEFHGRADLDAAEFHGDVEMRNAQFHGHANFDLPKFDRSIDLSGASATAKAALPRGWTLSSDSGPVEGVFLVIPPREVATEPAQGSDLSASR